MTFIGLAMPNRCYRKLNMIMKHFFVILALLTSTFTAWAQESMITISGGYAFANIKDLDDQATGWRINALYEFNPQQGMFAHGIELGYINIKASGNILEENVTSTVSSFPIYYAPKLLFGAGKARAFVKGALGMQFASLKREGIVELKDHDAGFYGGGGAGVMINLGENLFINAEYEIAWVSNSFYKDGWLNSATGGIGIKFYQILSRPSGMSPV